MGRPARRIAAVFYNPKCGGVMPENGLNLGL